MCGNCMWRNTTPVELGIITRVHMLTSPASVHKWAGDQRSQGGDTFPDIAPARGGVWTIVWTP